MTAFVRAWRWTSVVEAANPSGIWALGAVGGGGDIGERWMACG